MKYSLVFLFIVRVIIPMKEIKIFEAKGYELRGECIFLELKNGKTAIVPTQWTIIEEVS